MDKDNLIGKVQCVNAKNISVKVDKEVLLDSIQINQIVQIRSTRTGEKIIGLVSKIIRKTISEKFNEYIKPKVIIESFIHVKLVGTLIENHGTKRNVFKRTLSAFPSIDANCAFLSKEILTEINKNVFSIREIRESIVYIIYANQDSMTKKTEGVRSNLKDFKDYYKDSEFLKKKDNILIIVNPKNQHSISISCKQLHDNDYSDFYKLD